MLGDLQQRGTARSSAPAILHSKPGSACWVQLCHWCLLRKGRSISHFSLSVLNPLLCRLHFQPAFADGHPAGAKGAGKAHGARRLRNPLGPSPGLAPEQTNPESFGITAVPLGSRKKELGVLHSRVPNQEGHLGDHRRLQKEALGAA